MRPLLEASTLSESLRQRPPLGRQPRAWLLVAAVGTVPVGLADHGVSTSKSVGAFFCEYACSDSPTTVPSAGSCFRPEVVFSSQGDGWLEFISRDASRSLPRNFWASWVTLVTGDMTWDGWFRVPFLPAQDNMLIGTYGANHDSDLYDIASRRRYAAVEIDTAGAVVLRTNTGTSSGSVAAPTHINVTDGHWHHFAVSFRQDGGARITLQLKVNHFHHLNFERTLNSVPALLTTFEDAVKNALAATAKQLVEGVRISYEDGRIPSRYLEQDIRFIILTASVNTPLADERKSWGMLSRTAARNVAQSVNDWWVVTQPTLAVIIVTGEVYASLHPADDPDALLPVTEMTGSATFYVDGHEGEGSIVFSPGVVPREENVAMDGQLLFCGGKLGKALDCEASRLRIWDFALTPAQLEQVSGCTMPSSLDVIFGGDSRRRARRRRLQASYALAGLENSVPFEETAFAALSVIGGGKFIEGGLCGPGGHCPLVSPRGCMLKRAVNFTSMARCEAFASWNTCKSASAGRARPAHTAASQGGSACRVGVEGLGVQATTRVQL